MAISYDITKDLRVEIIRKLLDIEQDVHLQQLNLQAQELLDKEDEDYEYRRGEAKR